MSRRVAVLTLNTHFTQTRCLRDGHGRRIQDALLSRRERLRRSLELPDAPCAMNEDNPRPETLAQVELLPAEVKEWDDAMHAWTQARCSWRERSWGSLSRLYISHIEHAHQAGGMFAPDRETFVAIVMALGFQIVDGMVSGLILAEDWQAAHWKPEPAKVKPVRRKAERK